MTKHKLKAGRPTSYEENMPERVMEYLDERSDEDVVKREGENFTEYKKKVRLPTMQGLAIHLGVSRLSLYKWAKIYPDFAFALEMLVAEQHDRLVDNGLSGDYSPGIAKLILSSDHGYIERRDLTTNGKEFNPTPIIDVSKNNSDAQDHQSE